MGHLGWYDAKREKAYKETQQKIESIFNELDDLLDDTETIETALASAEESQED